MAWRALYAPLPTALNTAAYLLGAQVTASADINGASRGSRLTSCAKHAVTKFETQALPSGPVDSVGVHNLQPTPRASLGVDLCLHMPVGHTTTHLASSTKTSLLLCEDFVRVSLGSAKKAKQSNQDVCNGTVAPGGTHAYSHSHSHSLSLSLSHTHTHTRRRHHHHHCTPNTHIMHTART